MPGSNHVPGFPGDGPSWGDMGMSLDNAPQPRSGQFPHSDSGLFMPTKPSLAPEQARDNLLSINNPANFTPASSPPLPIAAPPTRASADEGTSTITGASAINTIDVDAIPTSNSKPQQNGSKRPKAVRGRTHGPLSGRPIQLLRAQAEAGSVEAALKLGWAVERMTKIFNENKRKRGVFVSDTEPIDDPILLTRIAERKHNARLATQRRTNGLKERIAKGDVEAARKLGLGKRTMEEMMEKVIKEKADKVKREERSSAEAVEAEVDWDRLGDQSRSNVARDRSMSSAGTAVPHIKTEQGQPMLDVPQFNDQRANIRDSFGKMQNFPGFTPLPAFTPSIASAIPAASPTFVPATATPQVAMPQVAMSQMAMPQASYGPTTFRPQPHMPVMNRAVELTIKFNERAKFFEYAQFMMREVQDEIKHYQASQAQLAQGYYGHYPQESQSQSSRSDDIGQLPAANGGQQFQWIEQTGHEETDFEEGMQMAD